MTLIMIKKVSILSASLRVEQQCPLVLGLLLSVKALYCIRLMILYLFDVLCCGSFYY